MIYKYEEYTDPETNEITIIEHVVTRDSYEHFHNFMHCMEWAGQSGNSIFYGMDLFWCVIYCGY